MIYKNCFWFKNNKAIITINKRLLTRKSKHYTSNVVIGFVSSYINLGNFYQIKIYMVIFFSYRNQSMNYIVISRNYFINVITLSFIFLFPIKKPAFFSFSKSFVSIKSILASMRSWVARSIRYIEQIYTKNVLIGSHFSNIYPQKNPTNKVSRILKYILI